MKYVLITGASRGIGAAAAREFARRGWGVAIHYHNSREAAETLARELAGLGVPTLTVAADMADAGAVEGMMAQVLAAFPHLDALVCNAGMSHVGLLSDVDEACWARVMSVNAGGVYRCCRAALPHFIHRKAGSIVTVSSMWGQVGASCEVAYSASKGAVIAFTRALAKEVGPSGIRVNCVAPGVIHTEMNGHLSAEDLDQLAEETPLCRIGQPEEVARTIAFLASEDASFVTGQVLGVTGGMI